MDDSVERRCAIIAKINCVRACWPDYFIDVDTDSHTYEQLSTSYYNAVRAIYSNHMIQ